MGATVSHVMERRALAEATEWLDLHWDSAPSRLHEQGVEPDSALGAPAMTHRFMAWVSFHDCEKVEQEITVECHHPRRGEVTIGNRPDPCPDCQDTGVKSLPSERYRWPMRAALWNLDHHVHVPPRTPKYGEALKVYRLMDWDLGATVARLWPGTKTDRDGETFLLEAIRLLRTRYAEGPVRRPRNLSESQSIAEALVA